MHSIDQNSKDIYNEIKYLLLYFFIQQNNYVINVSFHKNIKQHSVFNRIILRNVSSAPNQHIRMVSGGSYDTED